MSYTVPQLPPPPPGKTGWPWTVETTPFSQEQFSGQKLPKISIVTPSYNQGLFLEQTIRSVLLQKYPNLEYIIIDGGSTDSSLEIIEKYAQYFSYWISELDRGQTHALNKGFSHATGDFLCWLNSDDLFLNGALNALAEAVIQNSEGNWFIGRIEEIDEYGSSLKKVSPRYKNEQGWYSFVATRQFDTELQQPATFFSRRAWVAAGELDESLRYVMDFDYWGRLAYLGFRPNLVNYDIAGFRIHGESKTNEGLLPFWLEEIKVIDKWLKVCSGYDRRQLLQCRRFLKYGCMKLRLIRTFSKFYGDKEVDRLVTMYCDFKKKINNYLCKKTS